MSAFVRAVAAMFGDSDKLADMRRAAGQRARAFDVGVAEPALASAVNSILNQTGQAPAYYLTNRSREFMVNVLLEWERADA